MCQNGPILRFRRALPFILKRKLIGARRQDLENLLPKSVGELFAFNTSEGPRLKVTTCASAECVRTKEIGNGKYSNKVGFHLFIAASKCSILIKMY
jgi:hypothetical protein